MRKSWFKRYAMFLEKRKNIKIILRSELFDKPYYLFNNPDVATKNIDPIVHYYMYGWKESRNPSEFFNTSDYLALHKDVAKSGVNPLLHYIIYGKKENRLCQRSGGCSITKIGQYKLNIMLHPILFYEVPHLIKNRVTVITDSIGSDSLFGGVITAIIFAIKLAQERNADIRIVSRMYNNSPARLKNILDTLKIDCVGDISYCFIPPDSDKELDVADNDTFIATSWWNTYAILKSINPKNIIYIIQEDERMFYAYGDEHLLCNEVMSNNKISFAINTKLLYDHLLETGLSNIKVCGHYFEPAFDKNIFYWQEDQHANKYKLFFYARPNNARNLFCRGLEVLDKAVSKGIIDIQKWEIYFVGNGVPDNVHLTNGYCPIVIASIAYDAYGEFIRQMDLGLCLMYTPHPSYPPLDLAASGAVVVTNSFGNKTDLSMYSDNIIVTGTNTEDLIKGLEQGIALAEDGELRLKNYYSNKIIDNWDTVMNDFVKQF